MTSQIQDQKITTEITDTTVKGRLTQWRRGLGAGIAAIAVGLSGTPAFAGGSIQVGPNFSGSTHGSVATAGASHSCGELSQTFTLNLANDSDTLRVRVANGPLVMLVNGPGGEYCIKSVNGVAEMEGYWSSGQYRIQVGRRAGTAQDVPFNLTVSAR